MVINFVLPFPALIPIGGVKSFYEYANRLVARGHTVNILHSVKTNYIKNKTPWPARFLYYKLKNAEWPKWFKLDKRINSKIIPEVKNKYIPDGDIIMSTWWSTAFEVDKLDDSKGKKFNLIQDYETWMGEINKVNESFKLKATKIVVATYLSDIIKQYSNDKIYHIPYGFDELKFKILKSIKNRKKDSIIMLYSEESRKGSTYGLKAILKLKEKYPDLKATFFSVFQRNNNIPQWINYFQNPNNLPELYNEHAIFLTSSINEGFGMPAAEAMYCGCAVVATNVDGHKDFALHNKTAISVEPKNVDAIVNGISLLIENEDLRIKISENGNKNIQKYNWDYSTNLLEDLFKSCI
ncbi:MAG: glycosyltransferase family 4 protein [Bacteroidia bacterium]